MKHQVLVHLNWPEPLTFGRLDPRNGKRLKMLFSTKCEASKCNAQCTRTHLSIHQHSEDDFSEPSGTAPPLLQCLSPET